MVIARKGVGVSGVAQRGEMKMERKLAWGNGCTIQCVDDVLLSCILETGMV